MDLKQIRVSDFFAVPRPHPAATLKACQSASDVVME